MGPVNAVSGWWADHITPMRRGEGNAALKPISSASRARPEQTSWPAACQSWPAARQVASRPIGTGSTALRQPRGNRRLVPAQRVAPQSGHTFAPGRRPVLSAQRAATGEHGGRSDHIHASRVSCSGGDQVADLVA
jgi:hypothetical protein